MKDRKTVAFTRLYGFCAAKFSKSAQISFYALVNSMEEDRFRSSSDSETDIDNYFSIEAIVLIFERLHSSFHEKQIAPRLTTLLR